jgi:GDPmannose 4,6-dehydratase
MDKSYKDMNINNINEIKKFLPHNRINQKVVVVTGVTGQDGSLMADYLIKNTNHIVFGGARRLSVPNHKNIEHLVGCDRFKLINFDLTDSHSISQLINAIKPDYFINLAAQSFVKASWELPSSTWESNTTGVLNILESIRLHSPSCHFYNAGSSEEFGDVAYSPQDENHPLRPRSPYAASKAAARQIVKVQRESYNMYAVQGWLFNHEGVRRGEDFVTRKITMGVAKITKELKDKRIVYPLELGNLDAMRDWSDAEDMVDAIWRMVNQENFSDTKVDIYNQKELVASIKDYVCASGESHSVREFVECAFAAAGINGQWSFPMQQSHNPTDETFVYVDDEGQSYILVKINPAHFRPAEVDCLGGDSTLIRKELKWNPKTKFPELVAKMVARDLELVNLTL